MKGAYIVRLNLTESHLLGVARKIEAQIKALSRSVAEMDLYFLEGGAIMKNDKVLRQYGTGPFGQRITYYFRFYLFMAEYPLDADFVYVRYQRSSPVLLYMLSRLKSRYPGLIVLIELPSYPYHTEDNSIRGRVLGAIDRMSRRYLYRYVDRIVTFSQETELFGIPTILTDNGVDMQETVLSPIPHDTQTVRLIGVANLSFWHGYDRIIAGLAEYYASDKNRRVIFDIVGTGRELDRLQRNVLQKGMTDHVIFLGPMHGRQLDKVISESHIGISTLGIHRLKCETSTLKSREFCVQSLPFIMGYRDNDFDKDLPFVFHVPANNDPVDIQGILDFYDNLVTKQPDFRQRMRKYAEQHLTWEIKLKPVVRFIQESVTNRNL